MIRFFVDPGQIDGDRVLLGADDAHHLRAVLKAVPGYRLAVLDGLGTEFLAELVALSKTQASARILSRRDLGTEPAMLITVAQALPKMADRLEQVLQRGTEIGVSSFWCYASARSVTHLDGDRHAKRLQRARTIVKTAAEQAHRARLPDVRIDGTLADVAAAAPAYDVGLIAYEGESARPLRHALDGAAGRTGLKLLLIVGPEGGFDDEEVASAVRAGLTPVGLGPRILRTETAALVAVSQILYALEPF